MVEANAIDKTKIILNVLKDPNLLCNIVKVIQKEGVIGEEKPIKIEILICVGKKTINKRHFSTNLHPEDSSNIGKDHVTGKTKEIVFYKDWIEFPSPTPKAIIYSQRTKNEGTEADPVWVVEGTPITNDSILYVRDANTTFLNDDDNKVFFEKDVDISKTIEGHAVRIRCKKPIVIITTADTVTAEQLIGRMPSMHLDNSENQTKNINKHQLEEDCGIIEKMNKYDSVERDKYRECFYLLVDVIVDVASVKEYIKKKTPPHYDVVMRRLYPRLLDLVKFCATLHQFQRKILGNTMYKDEEMSHRVIEATKEDVDIGFLAFDYLYKSDLPTVSTLNARQLRIYDKLKKNALLQYTRDEINTWKISEGVTYTQTKTDLKLIIRADECVKMNDDVKPIKYWYNARDEKYVI